MTQVQRFHPSGSFVVHRIEIGGCRYTAWLDADGHMTDCERTFPSASRIPARQQKLRESIRVAGLAAERLHSAAKARQ